ncbi:MAG TPA: radical SAM protein [Chitinivibrionales bacterium]|nr:radical SAM protein [Chitinivibrionales bacterium]
MDIALVNPGPAPGNTPLKKEPLGLAFLAAYLEKHGYEVCIIDEISGAHAETELLAHRPKFVGITAMTMFVPRAYQIADFVKRELDATVIMGGVHPSARPEESLGHCDAVVTGEGEKALLDIVTNNSVKHGEKKIIHGAMLENLDELPPPSRHLIDMAFYLRQKDQISGSRRKTASLLTSRGCPFSCVFCHNSLRKIPVRYQSASRVVAEVEYLVKKYGIKGLAITDECFTGNKNRVRDICSLLVEKGLDTLKWECQAQAGTLDENIITLLKKAGCDQVALGFESGSQRILDVLEKGTRVDVCRRTIRLCNDGGIRVRGCFIVGTPSETEEDIALTEKFIDENKIDFVSIHFLTPYPSTKLWQQCKGAAGPDGRVDWGQFTTGNPFIQPCNTAIAPERQREIFERLQIKYVFRNYSLLLLAWQGIKQPREVVNYVHRFVRLVFFKVKNLVSPSHGKR